MSSILFYGNPNADLYPYAISTRYQEGLRLWDVDYGLIQDPEVYDKVRRDAVVSHAMQFRQHLVAGPAYNVQPGGSQDVDKRAAAIIEDILDRIPSFATARFLLSKAVFKGRTYARMYGARKQFPAGQQAAQNWWVPSRLKDVDKRRVRFMVGGEEAILMRRTASGVFEKPETVPSQAKRVVAEMWSVQRGIWEKIEHPDWLMKHVYNDEESALGHGRGLMEPLYFYFRAKTKAMEEGLQALEKWAQGMTIVGIDPGAAPSGTSLSQLAQAYVDEFEKMRARHTLAHSKNDEVTVMPGPGQGWQIITEMINYFDNKITTLILGANLPTTATSGGSYALAEIQENSTDALIKYDQCILDETITRDLIGLIWRVNRPQFAALGLADAAMPEYVTTNEKHADPEQASRVLATLLGAGMAVREDEAYKNVGYTPPGPGDKVIRGQVPGGLPPMPGLDLPPEPDGAPEPKAPAAPKEPQAPKPAGSGGQPQVVGVEEEVALP